jgi:Fe-S cluster assembly protein SufB
MVHLAPNTYSNILSKSLSLDGGQSSFRGLVSLGKSAVRSLAKVSCQALLLDNKSRSDSYPKIINEEKTATVEHEAFISRLSSDQLLYLQSRGLKEAEATSLLALGFLEPVLKDVPLEYTLELNNLMAVVMENYYEEK